MNVKYQVFISSTYEDLRAERDQVIKAVLEMGHIPVGMEMFSAADEEQWKIIMRQIDESDYYVVIVAHRYGSVVESVSYTEKEYDYALSKSVPIIGFIIDNSAAWPADRVDTDTDKKAAVQAFKEKLRRKPIGTWTTSTDLYGKFSIALMKLTTANPRPGWVRSTEVSGPEVMAELTRLSSENARLRNDAALLKAEQDEATRYRELLTTLKNIQVTPALFYVGASEWSPAEETSLYRIFYILAPELMTERSTSRASGLLGLMFAKGKAIRKTWPIPSNSMNSWLADLMAFGLVEPSAKAHPIADKDYYWTLTATGREAFAQQRRALLETRAREAVERKRSEREASEPTHDEIGMDASPAMETLIAQPTGKDNAITPAEADTPEVTKS